MAKRNIVKVGDDILRKKSKAVTVFDDRLAELLDDMRETMVSEHGVGIAAVQVGILRRACVVSHDGKEFFEFVNPEIIKASGKQKSSEGCLSIPNTNGEVQRPKRIVIKAQDRFGNEFEAEATEFLAVICCHEFDHMDGVLFTDKILQKSKK